MPQPNIVRYDFRHDASNAISHRLTLWACLAIADPYEIGYRDGNDYKAWFKDKKIETPQDLIEYNFDDAPALNVPGDWNTQRPEFYYYDSALWYRRLFDAQPKQSQRQ